MKGIVMKSRYYFLVIYLIIFFSLLNFCLPLEAETPQQQEKFSFGFSFYHTSLVVGELTTLSGTYELFAAVPVSNKIKIYGILPFSTYTPKSGAGETKSGIGNLVLGLKYYFGEKMNYLFKGGIALPTINENELIGANFYSYMSRFYDLEKFATDHTALFTEFQYKYAFDENYSIGAGTGLKLLIWTGSGSNDADLFLPFNVFFEYVKNEVIRFNATFKGIYYLTNENSDFGDNFMNILHVKISYPGRIVEPGLILESPMSDNYEKWLDYNIGLFILVKIK